MCHTDPLLPLAVDPTPVGHRHSKLELSLTKNSSASAEKRLDLDEAGTADATSDTIFIG